MVFNKRILVLIIIFGGGMFPCLLIQAQQQKNNERLNFDLSINDKKIRKDSTKINYFSLGLFCDKYNLKGIQVEALWSADKNISRGIMISGLAGIAHKMNGAQISGLNSVIMRQMKGLQISAILNVAWQSMNGIQISIIDNYTPRLNGLQLSAVNNIVSEELDGVQFSGVVNMAVRAKRSLQFASLVNVCQSTFSGVQIAATNFTDTLKGLQIGLVNVCGRHSSGIQIGLMNWSHNSSTRIMGLVNVNPSTRIQMMLYGGNASKINMAVRFRNRRVYTIVGLGTPYLGMNEKFSGCLFYRNGLLFPIFSKLELGGDLGYYHIENFQNNNANIPERMYSLQARMYLEFKLQTKLGVFLSSGYSLTRYYDRNKFYERKPIIEAGIILF